MMKPEEMNVDEGMSRKKTYIIVGILVIIAVVSFFFVSNVASSEDNFTGTYKALDDKRVTVTELMGVTAAASTAITAIPDDIGTPIAEQLADLSGYFMFIIAAICLEKWMVTMTGMLAFKILIPIGCAILIAAVLMKQWTWREIGIKLILVALMIFAVVPSSVMLTKQIDATYQQSIEQTIEDSKKDSQNIKENTRNKDENAVKQFFNSLKGKVTGTIDKFEDLLSRVTEAIAVLIVTSCAIPIAVLLFFIWIIKLVTGTEIKIPRPRISKIINKKGL